MTSGVNRIQTQHPNHWTTPPPKSIMNKIVTIAKFGFISKLTLSLHYDYGYLQCYETSHYFMRIPEIVLKSCNYLN